MFESLAQMTLAQWGRTVGCLIVLALIFIAIINKRRHEADEPKPETVMAERTEPTSDCKPAEGWKIAFVSISFMVFAIAMLAHFVH